MPERPFGVHARFFLSIINNMYTMTETTFFELDAPGLFQGAQHRRVHCLIELEHAADLDARLCWLQATARACEILQRTLAAH